MHGNLDSPGGGIPVVDSGTGETIAHVARASDVKRGVALGGRLWNARVVDGEVRLTAREGAHPRGGFLYAARRGPTGHEYAVHVRRGLGFDERDAPVAWVGKEPVWLHFGGGAYETVLAALIPWVRPLAGLAGLAMAGHPGVEAPRQAASGEEALREAMETHCDVLESPVAPGPFHPLLPEALRRRLTAALFDAERFRRWLAGRRVWELSPDDPRQDAVRAALGGLAEEPGVTPAPLAAPDA